LPTQLLLQQTIFRPKNYKNLHTTQDINHITIHNTTLRFYKKNPETCTFFSTQPRKQDKLERPNTKKPSRRGRLGKKSKRVGKKALDMRNLPDTMMSCRKSRISVGRQAGRTLPVGKLAGSMKTVGTLVDRFVGRLVCCRRPDRWVLDRRRPDTKVLGRMGPDTRVGKMRPGKQVVDMRRPDKRRLDKWADMKVLGRMGPDMKVFGRMGPDTKVLGKMGPDTRVGKMRPGKRAGCKKRPGMLVGRMIGKMTGHCRLTRTGHKRNSSRVQTRPPLSLPVPF
jgi:hypothetical protein